MLKLYDEFIIERHFDGWTLSETALDYLAFNLVGHPVFCIGKPIGSVTTVTEEGVVIVDETDRLSDEELETLRPQLDFRATVSGRVVTRIAGIDRLALVEKQAGDKGRVVRIYKERIE